MTDAPTYDSLTEAAKCELLARAMEWSEGKQLWHPPSGPSDEHIYTIPPNPFTSADDYRALRLWADGAGAVVILYAMDCVQAWASIEDWRDDYEEDSKCVTLDLNRNAPDYNAECRAVIKALGRVLELWT